MSRSEDFEERVTGILRRLKPGEVITYGEVAEEAGFTRAARAVGNLLAKGIEGVPWWRVVRADGSLAAEKSAEQARLLEAEGAHVEEGRVALPDRKRRG